MAVGRGLTPVDLRAMLRLSHALHTSGDPYARKQLLLSGLCELLGAISGVSVIAHVDAARRRHTVVSVTCHGAERMRDEQILARCLASLKESPTRLHNGQHAPAEWQHLGWPVKASRTRRLHHCLWCKAPNSQASVVACLGLMRDAITSRPFGSRERVLLQLMHTEVSWIYQADLILASRGAASLSPRQRQTLQYLLAGNSEKEIAERMRLSRNTVHHHVKAIHKHFDVSTRSELLARWVR